MSMYRRCALALGAVIATALTRLLAAQAPPPPSLDSLQLTILSAKTDSGAKAALERALFALQASNRLADSLLARAVASPDPRAVAFASLGLVPYHDPRTIPPLLRRALLPETKGAERFYLMNSSAYILGIGDALLLWRGDLDSGTVRTARGLLEIADSSARYGLGMEHARRLRELADDSAARADPDYGLAIWHLSAYLCGTLDLRSEPLLTGFLQPTNRTVFANVAGALALLSGEDVIAPLRDRKDVTKTEEEAAAAKARNWWHAYLRDHADGDWRPAAQATLQRAGYLTAKDSLRKNASPAQLLAAIRSHDRLVRYAAYRLLNDTYGANFDLQSVFCSGKYAMSFRNPEGQEDATERNLREYWERRFTNGSGR